MDHGPRIVLTGERANGVQIVELRDRDEFHLVAGIASQQIRALIARDACDAREHVRAQHALVLVGVLRLRPSVPDAADHALLVLERDAQNYRGGEAPSWE